MDCGQHKTLTGAGDDADKGFVKGASLDSEAVASPTTSMDVGRLVAMLQVGSVEVVVSSVSVQAAIPVDRTFYSTGSISLSWLMTLAVESCEVIVDASIVALAQQKLQQATDPSAVHPSAEDCCDSDSLDDWNLATAGGVKMHHPLTDAPVVMNDLATTSLNSMALKEIESLSYVAMMMSCDLTMLVRMSAFLVQQLQLNYLTDSTMVAVHQLTVMAC